MSYHFTKDLDIGFEEALEKVTEELKKEEFGILSDIDVKATLKEKIDMDFRNYRILGSCNPNFAYKALSSEPNIGLMLPCNVIVQELDDGKIRVSAIDPIASMMAVKNESLGEVAIQVQDKMKSVIDRL